jgi:hypothetical protein
MGRINIIINLAKMIVRTFWLKYPYNTLTLTIVCMQKNTIRKTFRQIVCPAPVIQIVLLKLGFCGSPVLCSLWDQYLIIQNTIPWTHHTGHFKSMGKTVMKSNLLKADSFQN